MDKNTVIGPIMIDIAGPELDEKERERISHSAVGGLILFTRNFQSSEQLGKLVREIRKIKKNIIIAVDHEGGRVQRFREGFTQLPAMAKLGELYASDEDAAIEAAVELGWLMASELRAFDIDISFAPVLDRNHGISEVIGDRAFSDCPETIVELTAAFIRGMHSAGMASTGKHFPGHGCVEADSHIAIPVDNRESDCIFIEDMAIFKQMVFKGMDAVMPAHVIYPSVDSNPAGFSEKWIKDILREQCRFDGVVFSDDLSMEGASVAGSFPERALAAFNAGCDMILVCNNPIAADEVIEHFDESFMTQERSNRLKRMLGKGHHVPIEQLQEQVRWKKALQHIAAIG